MSNSGMSKSEECADGYTIKRNHKTTNIFSLPEANEMAPAYKLTYFPSKALGEPARLLMKYGGIEFEDDRFEREQWPQIKLTMPFGQVPVLTVNGKQYNQSMAIARMLAKQVKLAGKDEWEDIEIDAIVDTVNDLRMKISMYSYETDAAVKELFKTRLFNETLPYYLDQLDAVAKENNGHLALKKLTWADIYFVGVLDHLNYMVGMDITEKHSSLAAIKTNVLAIPAIKSWVEVRPKTEQ